MSTLTRKAFLRSMPDAVIPALPAYLRGAIQTRQPWGYLVQFHFGEPRLHYEISPIARRDEWEIGFHWEARDKKLNKLLLLGFRRHLFEIKETLGDGVEAEMWDRGWAKIYEIQPGQKLTSDFQAELGNRMAFFIRFLHPFFVELRKSVSRLGG